jgi:dTDP-4-dehydrorhamnose 3,5-epimerase
VPIEPMTVETTAIEGQVIVTLKAASDERGVVREFFRGSDFAAQGVSVPDRWQQVNLTWTQRGGVRGLHGEAMTKLVGLAAGEAFGVYVDARPGSSTYGAVVTVPLVVGKQVLVPAGVLNGFQATTDCMYVYCFDQEWVPGMAGVAVTPLDEALGVQWPLPLDASNPAILSAKDASAPLFADLPTSS